MAGVDQITVLELNVSNSHHNLGMYDDKAMQSMAEYITILK